MPKNKQSNLIAHVKTPNIRFINKYIINSGIRGGGAIQCCCCSANLSPCHWTASDANLLNDLHTFHYQDYFVIGGIRICLRVSDDPKFLWISSNSCPLNLLLVQSHQAEIIIVKRLIQGRNNVTRVRVEPRSCDQGRRKNDAFTHSATLPTR